MEKDPEELKPILRPDPPKASGRIMFLAGLLLLVGAIVMTLFVIGQDQNVVESAPNNPPPGSSLDVQIPLQRRNQGQYRWDSSQESLMVQVEDILREVPLIDGHNDHPWNIRELFQNQVSQYDFNSDLSKVEPWASNSRSHTDLPRLKKGMVGGQFWAAYVECSSQRKDAVILTLEQIDVIKKLVDKYPEDLKFTTTARGIEEAHSEGKIASLIGVEGGHSISSSLGVLRTMYQLGARYLTLTHNCNTPWADCALVDNPGMVPVHNGLTKFGKVIVSEMNRLGMMVDLSHVSVQTMKDALHASRAPVIFSHSSAYALCNHTRNVPDDVLRLVHDTNSLVMVNFYSDFLAKSHNATLHDVVAHINHIRNVAGVDHVGIGSDYDGVQRVPVGLEDVSKFPYLFAELLKDPRWTAEDLKKLAGLNLLRVFKRVEQVRDEMKDEGIGPHGDWISQQELGDNTECISNPEELPNRPL